ncbi:YicC/YloC family endoribonuclease [Thiomicrorhabdus lithotrophica]|uniref:YicC family protein n=1 Tax=Thiomicrorhabdus lithotrophica TaxID=2949997 RepID=A0ABY8C946_9GAMM|nr:YicC/YloC family endoribonuclease [Thiomicrorhabdus lithotrophica]WEJ62489.1 YicC family protein [Thiomicrorhabdus lithotrophica]
MSKPANAPKTFTVKSMTAFARVQENNSFGRYSWEIRSVNQRYLEINPRLPDAYRHLEPTIRELLKKHIARGKIDISLSYEVSSNQSTMQLNIELLKSLNTAVNQVQQTMQHTSEVNPLEALKWPGILHESSNNIDSEKMNSELLKSLQTTLQLFTEHQIREGQALAHMIHARCVTIAQQVKQLEPELPTILENHTQKLKQRIQSLTDKMDEDRFHQEVAVLAQKMDVSEEIDRLKTHLEEVEQTLSGKTALPNHLNPIGRRLDFLMQELNREANTLGSKAIDTKISQTSVELKVLIEQMREQVQNIE